MNPALTLSIIDRRNVYAPGEQLICEYLLESLGKEDVHAIEASVLWYTEGKGDEDMSVHYFERRGIEHVKHDDLSLSHRFATDLPNSPLSYEGLIVKIRWCARLRVFLTSGEELRQESLFHLGDIPRARSRPS